MDRVHSDICGPLNPNTFQDYKYIVTFVDVVTRYAEIVLLKTKNEVFNEFKTFVIREKIQSGLKLKRLYFNNDLEYKNIEFHQFLTERGTITTFTASYVHEQNGLVEIFNRTLLNKVRVLLIQSGMPKSYWTEAVSAVTFIYNQTPHSTKNFVTPHELKYKEKSDISSLKIWDLIVYRKDYLTKKLDLRAIMRVLIGYESNQWRILDSRTKRVTWTRDVTIKEGHFYNDKNRGNDTPDQLLLEPDSNEATELTVDSTETNTLEDTEAIPQ